MNKSISFRTGMWWFVEGWQIFRRQPLVLISIFSLYSAAMFVLAILPFLGQIINIVLLPLFSIIFMSACQKISDDERVELVSLLNIRAIPHYQQLLKLGGLYLLFLLVATLPGLYFYGDSFTQILLSAAQNAEGNLAQVSFQHLLGGLILVSVCLLPVFLAFWFAPNLVAWHNMPLFKSLFFSLMAWRKHVMAWLGYISVFVFIGLVVPTLFVFVSGTIAPQLFAILIVPYLLWVSVMLYCSLYPCYRSFFKQ